VYNLRPDSGHKESNTGCRKSETADGKDHQPQELFKRLVLQGDRKSPVVIFCPGDLQSV